MPVHLGYRPLNPAISRLFIHFGSFEAPAIYLQFISTLPRGGVHTLSRGGVGSPELRDGIYFSCAKVGNSRNMPLCKLSGNLYYGVTEDII